MGIIPGPEKLAKKSIMTAITVPEGIIMLAIAVLFDLFGILCFILSFFGIGIVISFLGDMVGMVSLGFWATTRSFFRGTIEKSVSDITKKTLNVGGGMEGIKKFQGSSAPGLNAGKKVAKKGIKLGLSAVKFIVILILELIPFFGDILPGWTLFVIFELIQGEI